MKFEIWDTAGQERYTFNCCKLVLTLAFGNLYAVFYVKRNLYAVDFAAYSSNVVGTFLIIFCAQLTHLFFSFYEMSIHVSCKCIPETNIHDNWEPLNFRYAALAPLYYRGAAAAIVVYDITSPESFSKAQYWVKVTLFSSEVLRSCAYSCWILFLLALPLQ